MPESKSPLRVDELAVLRAAAQGGKTRETAAALGFSYSKVLRLRGSVMVKLDAATIANAVHVAHVAGILGARGVVPSPAAPITEGQLRAFHAKAGALDRRRNDEPGTTKAEIMVEAAVKFKRQLVSVSDLNSTEMSWALDCLAEQEAALA